MPKLPLAPLFSLRLNDETEAPKESPPPHPRASSLIIAKSPRPMINFHCLPCENQEVLNFQNDLLLSCFSFASFEVSVSALFETEEGGGNGRNKVDDDDEEEEDKDFDSMARVLWGQCQIGQDHGRMKFMGSFPWWDYLCRAQPSFFQQLIA